MFFRYRQNRKSGDILSFTVNKELRDFIEAVSRSYNVYAVVLFGSYAQGNAGEYSDIDVAVFSDDFGEDIFEDMKKLFQLRRRIDPDIEPLPFKKKDFFTHNKTDFIRDIVATGKLIYKEGKILI
ncbi:MAG: nucleotidyltransferase domain-containing protein [Nitrospirae bacterium]|nr:nucleotidyltransferase domain-containing protein [Nitrospirota bacterium]